MAKTVVNSPKCVQCNSVRMTKIDAKCSDQCHTEDLDTGNETNGYTSDNQRLDLIQKYGDNLIFTICFDCGRIQELGQ